MGFFNRATAIREKTFAPRNDIWGLKVDDNVPLNVAFLNDLSASVEVAVHFTNTGLTLCNFMYSEQDDPEANCMLCDQTDPRTGNKQFPAVIRAFLVFCYDLIGTKKQSKNGKEYDMNPLTVLTLPHGRKKVILDALNEADNTGDLLYSGKNIWKIRRIKGAGFNPPTLLTPGEFKKFSQQYDPEVPQDIMDRVEKMTPGELQGILLSIFGNLKQDFQEFKNLGIVFPSKGEEVAKTTSEDLDQ
jgi:hypothetical protein